MNVCKSCNFDLSCNFLSFYFQFVKQKTLHNFYLIKYYDDDDHHYVVLSNEKKKQSSLD